MSGTVEFENGTSENLKVAPVSDRAFRLWFNACCYCSRNLTDGRVPAILIAGLSRTANRRVIDELLVAGLLERLSTETFLVHDYLKHNPSRDEVQESRQRARERTSEWRRRNQRGAGDGIRDGDVTDNSTVTRVRVPAGAPEKKSSTELDRATKKTLLVVDSFAAQIRERDPQADVAPRSEAWLREARLLLERDGRSTEQVLAVLAWLATDDFWSSVVLSVPKFRAKFTQLVAKMNTAQKSPTSNGRTTAPRAAAARRNALMEHD